MERFLVFTYCGRQSWLTAIEISIYRWASGYLKLQIPMIRCNHLMKLWQQYVSENDAYFPESMFDSKWRCMPSSKLSPLMAEMQMWWLELIRILGNQLKFTWWEWQRNKIEEINDLQKDQPNCQTSVRLTIEKKKLKVLISEMKLGQGNAQNPLS